MSSESRRSFLTKLAAGSLVVTGAPESLSSSAAHGLRRQPPVKRRSLNDQIQVAVIGAGGMGRIDGDTARGIDGVKLIAACDFENAKPEEFHL